jgi:hypothetical protein
MVASDIRLAVGDRARCISLVRAALVFILTETPRAAFSRKMGTPLGYARYARPARAGGPSPWRATIKASALLCDALSLSGARAHLPSESGFIK